MSRTLTMAAVLVVFAAIIVYFLANPTLDQSVSVEEIKTETETGTIVPPGDNPVQKIYQALEAANLSNQGLVEVPQEIFSMTHLQQLNLSNNELSGSLPAEIRQLQNLLSLDLSNNEFTGVPAEIGQLQNLQILNLANNNLTGLPYELGNLGNLQILDLRGNAYAKQDLEVIKKSLPSSVEIRTD